MKAKRLLLPVAFVLLMVVLVLGITGLAVAAPATAVKGDVKDGYFADWGTRSEDDATGTWVWSDVVIVWTLSGDLEGTYTLTGTYSGKISLPADKITGTAHFEGALNGDEIEWWANVKGSGKADFAYDFAGRNFWKSTLYDGGKGQITIHQVYLYNEDPLIAEDHAAYWGEIK